MYCPGRTVFQDLVGHILKSKNLVELSISYNTPVGLNMRKSKL